MPIKPRTATVLIYQGDDLERLAELRRVADTAERIRQEADRAGNARAGDTDESKAKRDEYDAFVLEASERAESVSLQAIGRGRFRDLLREHPPRKVKGEDGEETHPDDDTYECNVETLPDALLTFVDGDVRSITSPEFGTRKACSDFLNNDLSAGDFETLWVTAYWLNAAPGADPKSSTYSLDAQNTSETPTSPSRLG